MKVKFLVLVLISSSFAGCMRNIEIWHGGPRVEFAEGFDVHGGANGVSHVKDTRGIAPRVSEQTDKF